MKTSKFTETQIVSILKQSDAGVPVKDVCRQAGISVATYSKWKSKYGGLKRMYAELALDDAAMKDLIAKNGRTGAQARGGAVPRGGSCAAGASVV